MLPTWFKPCREYIRGYHPGIVFTHNRHIIYCRSHAHTVPPAMPETHHVNNILFRRQSSFRRHSAGSTFSAGNTFFLPNFSNAIFYKTIKDIDFAPKDEKCGNMKALHVCIYFSDMFFHYSDIADQKKYAGRATGDSIYALKISHNTLLFH